MTSTIPINRITRGHYRALQLAKEISPRCSVHTSTCFKQKEKNVVYSPFPSVKLPNASIPHTIIDRAKKWSHMDAIECGMTGRKYTYGGMIDRALRWGSVVKKLLPEAESEQDRNVLLYSPNAPEFPIIVIGTQSVAGMITTINHSYTVDEVIRQLEDSDIKMAVVDPQCEKVLRSALDRLKTTIPIFTNGPSEFGSPNFREIIEDKNREFATLKEISPESIAMMLYSSGTTGKPKGTALSHRAFTNNMEMFTQPNLFPYRPTTKDFQEVTSGVLPFYHVYGSCVINMFNMYLGAKTVSLPAFTPADFIRIIQEHKMGVLHLVPPMLNFLVYSPAVSPSVLESMHSVMIAAAPVPPPTAKALKEKAPNPFVFQEGFGMTEALGTHMTPLDDEKIGYCGKPVSNVEVKVIDINTGEALPEGQRGEMCIRSPSLMSYYHNNPEATASTIDSEGWLHTGDVAIHEDGYFSIVDRLKELIKVKGYQVSPSELEEELLKHPGVVDVGVVGIPDERAGELPRAYIVRKGDTSEKDILNHMEEKVSSYKQLSGGIVFVDSLPKNPTGKLLRRVLKEMALNTSN